MTTARLWVALGAALVSLPGCSDVDSCLEYIDQGCLGSAPDDSGNCRFGLVRSDDGLTCVKPGTSGSVAQPDASMPDARPPGTDAGSTPNPYGSCSCATGQICRQDNTCVDTCVPLTNVPAAKDNPYWCRPVAMENAFNYQRAAQGLCSQMCVRRAAICGTACDVDTECAPAAAMLVAQTICPGNDAECAMKACESTRDAPCAQQQCPVGTTANCTGLVCNNACPQYTNDGLCDDGDLSSADSYVCDFGNDCGDCGPRRGTAQPKKLNYGDACTDPAQCGGSLGSVKTSTGWCVPASDEQDYGRCHPDCSNGKSCPAGFECLGVASDSDGDGDLDQFKDLYDGTPVYACFSMQCDG